MENYLRVFDTESEYDSVKDGLEYPTVSYVKDVDTIYYMMQYNELYEWIDLGLPSGLKWAAWNVGATKPEEFGLYFAWGETQGYTGITDEKQFSYADYKWSSDADGTTMTKYNATDGLTTLELTDDAATVVDSGCRMPTSVECQELIDNTTSEWVADYNGTGVSGRLLTSNNNGNSIFVPAAGFCGNGFLGDVGQYGNFWSSSLVTEHTHSQLVFYFGIDSETLLVDDDGRCNGLNVRPVKE